MKRLTIILLVLTFVFALTTGCANTTPATPDTQNTPDPSQTPDTQPPDPSQTPDTQPPDPSQTPGTPPPLTQETPPTQTPITQNPEPVELEDVVIGDGEYSCSLLVSCAVLVEDIEVLDRDKRELVPSDGVIYWSESVTFYEGESVFNVLQREMKGKRIHMEFRNTPGYNSAYILGINNIYEFDAGELSGWMYKVNGWVPNYGGSRYALQDGDAVEWHYTLDLGRALGEVWLEGGQQ